jgi:hypothetical protein
MCVLQNLAYGYIAGQIFLGAQFLTIQSQFFWAVQFTSRWFSSKLANGVPKVGFIYMPSIARL